MNFIRNHPYAFAFIIVFFFLLFLGVFVLEFTLSESFLGAAVISAMGVGSSWWKMEGFG